MATLIDPTTDRPIWSGPSGEGGSGSRQAVEDFARQRGLDPSGVTSNVMPDGRTAYYLPGQFVQNGNRAALGLDPLGSALSTAPGSRQPAVDALLEQAKAAASQKPAADDQAAATEARRARDITSEANLLYTYVPPALRQVFIDAWIKHGTAEMAMRVVRSDERYESFFPGNRRPDGSTILDEAKYLSTMEGYDRELSWFGLNPAEFQKQKVQALQNGRSPLEVGTAISKINLGIALKGDSYRDYYAKKYGGGALSNTAILASALDGTRSPYEFERQIQAAQVGGAAGMFGFDIARQEAERLQAYGLDDVAARQLYAKAGAQLPTLNALIDRFNDPDDELTIEEFADAYVLSDPKQLEQVSRLFAQDRSQFSSGGFAAASQSGAQRGLLAR